MSKKIFLYILFVSSFWMYPFLGIFVASIVAALTQIFFLPLLVGVYFDILFWSAGLSKDYIIPYTLIAFISYIVLIYIDKRVR